MTNTWAQLNSGSVNLLTATVWHKRKKFKGNSLSHWPRWAAAERRQVFLLLLNLQHQHQVGVLVFQVVKQERHEVVNDIRLVALPACVKIYCYTGVFQCNPLETKKDEKGTITGKAMRIYKLINRCVMAFIKKIHNSHCPSCRLEPSTISFK